MIPFAAFALIPGRTYHFKVQIGVVLDNEHLPYTDLIDFRVEVKKALFGIKYKLL